MNAGIVARFESFFEKKEDACWLWRGALSDGGYGRYGEHQRAHRVAYELYRGPIPEGFFVCHTCDVRHCVNPAHLFLGTAQDNIADMVAKGRSRGPRGELQGRCRLTESDVRAIYAASGNYVDIGHGYGISAEHVGNIKRRKRWAHLDLGPSVGVGTGNRN